MTKRVGKSCCVARGEKGSGQKRIRKLVAGKLCQGLDNVEVKGTVSTIYNVILRLRTMVKADNVVKAEN
jgi:hypothetical protein